MMSNINQSVFTELTQNPKAMFLTDSAGALLSTIFLFIIAKVFSGFGMPPTSVYILAGIAFMLYLYSLVCFFFMVERWKPYLALTIAGNILYSVLTIALMVHFSQQLQPLGWAYFVLELVVLYFLVYLEIKTVKSAK